MVNVVSFFPLLNLPNNALMNVLRAMGCVQQTGFSILSKRTKNIVKSLNWKVQSFLVEIGYEIKLSIRIDDEYRIDCFFHTREDLMIPPRNDMPLWKLPIPIIVRVNYYYRKTRQEVFIWKNPGLELKNWMDHLSTIFHHSDIEELVFEEGCDRYDIGIIRKTFNNCTGIDIHQACFSYSQLALKAFLPTKRLCLEKIPFQHNESLHQILLHNFDVIDLIVDDAFHGFLRFTLDELLMINSSYMRIINSKLTLKDINRFIKLWINGSNPRMEYMFIDFPMDTILHENIILNGIDHLIVSPEEKRIYKKTVQDWPADYSVDINPFITNGRFDIKRKDGQKATIITGSRNLWPMFKLCVWQ